MPEFKAYIDYLSLEKNYAQHTVKAYVSDLREFTVFCDGNYDDAMIKNVNYQQIRSWIVSMSENGVENRTINRKISSLKNYYKFLLKIEEIEVSPLVKHKALKVAKKVQIPFSKKEMDSVLDDLVFSENFEGVRDRLIIEVFYVTGIRKAELIGLKVSDVDIGKKTLKVLGKRNKERIVPLTERIIKNIESYIIERGKIVVEQGNDNLFLTKRGAKIYDSLVYRIINLYFSMASSKLKKSPHVLRHTFATHLLNEGADLNAVKELLGHTSLAATQVYTHNSMAKLKEVYGKSHPRTRKN